MAGIESVLGCLAGCAYPLCLRAGKLILETDTTLAKAPDGNGGVYLALARSGALAHMKEHVSGPWVASKG